MQRRAAHIATASATALALGSVVLAEAGLRVRNRRPSPSSAAEAAVAGSGARWQSEQIRAQDDVILDAWLFTPARSNGAAVLLLHGNKSRRQSMMPHVPYLLAAGYTVLVPDSRGHGSSGGAIETYGLREVGDLQRWIGLLGTLHGITRFYGLGESLGGAILIESLPTETRLHAVVADCPFATFEEAAYNRLQLRLYLPRLIAWAPLGLGLAYGRVMYGVDLRQAAPIDAIRRARTPVLLIHGAADRSTPIYHSRQLHAANPAATELWEVAGAGHTRSRIVQPLEYQQRVLRWFGEHP